MKLVTLILSSGLLVTLAACAPQAATNDANANAANASETVGADARGSGDKPDGDAAGDSAEIGGKPADVANAESQPEPAGDKPSY